MELLSLKTLYEFVVLAQSQNLTEAAKRLSKTQQALSKSLSQLESELAVKLIKRRPWTLTGEGQKLLEEAFVLLEKSNALEKQIMQIGSSQLAGQIRLSAPSYLDAETWLLLKSFLQKHPNLTLQLQLNLSAQEAENRLQNNQLDLALLPCKPLAKGLQLRAFGQSPLVIVAKEMQAEFEWDDWHYLAVSAPAPMGDLLSWPSEFPRKVVTETDLQSAIQLACLGNGALFVPQNAIQKELESGSLQIVATPPFERDVYLWLTWLKSRAHLPLVLALLQALKAESNTTLI